MFTLPPSEEDGRGGQVGKTLHSETPLAYQLMIRVRNEVSKGMKGYSTMAPTNLD